MKIIKIKREIDGGHQNQEFFSNFTDPIPEGWAIIPDNMSIPNTFPFVDIEVENGVVIAMTAGVVPEPETELIPQPTAMERIEAQVAYTAMMTDTLLEEG